MTVGLTAVRTELSFKELPHPGLLGDLQQGVAEIGWANLFVTKDRFSVMDFSNQYLTEPTCFLFKRPNPYSGIFSLVFPLRAETWFAILASLAAVAAFYRLHGTVLARYDSSPLTFGKLMLYEASVSFRESNHYTHVKTTQSLR